MYRKVIFQNRNIEKIIYMQEVLYLGKQNYPILTQIGMPTFSFGELGSNVNILSSHPDKWEGGWWDVSGGGTSGTSAHFRTKPSYKVQVKPNTTYTFNGTARLVPLEYRANGTYTNLNNNITSPPKTYKTGGETTQISIFLFQPAAENNINNIKNYNFQITETNGVVPFTKNPYDFDGAESEYSYIEKGTTYSWDFYVNGVRNGEGTVLFEVNNIGTADVAINGVDISSGINEYRIPVDLLNEKGTLNFSSSRNIQLVVKQPILRAYGGG